MIFTIETQMYVNSVKYGLTDLGRKASRELLPGTVLLVNSGVSLGTPKILGIKGCINDGIAAFLNLDNRIRPEFLYIVLLAWLEIIQNLNQGVYQINLNTEIIGKLKIPVPSLAEQNLIVNHISILDNLIEKYTISQSTWLKIKLGMMQQLLTGRIRVKF